MFPPLPLRTVRWRPLEGEGMEHLTIGPALLSSSAGSSVSGTRACGVIIGERGETPYGVSYTIACDDTWHVRRLDLQTTDGRALTLVSNVPGQWFDADGIPLPHLDGCIDIDLAGTPFTNTLPIRRLNMTPLDGAVSLRMLYIPFDTFEPLADRQTYTCLEPGRSYRYTSGDRSFTADLPVDADGLVIDYPTLFQRL